MRVSPCKNSERCMVLNSSHIRYLYQSEQCISFSFGFNDTKLANLKETLSALTKLKYHKRVHSVLIDL